MKRAAPYRGRKRGRRRKALLGVCAACLAAAAVFCMRLERTGQAMEAYILEPREGTAGPVILDVPFIDQREKYPTGCESVSAVMALQYAGVDVTPEEFIDGYLPRGTAPYPDGDGGYISCDPRQAFPGDPYTQEGWGCYAPVILSAAEDILRERDAASLSIEDLSGSTLGELYRDYVRGGVPVLVWDTIGMEPPQEDALLTIEGTGEAFRWIYPMHCMVLVGADEASYYFNDPMAGKAVPFSREASELAYEGLGRQALAFVPRA